MTQRRIIHAIPLLITASLVLLVAFVSQQLFQPEFRQVVHSIAISTAVSTPAATATLSAADYAFDATPGPDVPTLHEIAVAAGAQTDTEILDAAVAYYAENQDRLAVLWREDHPDRLAGLFSMYLIHIGYVYGVADFPTSLVDFLSQERGHCATVTYAQFRLAERLGLTWRVLVSDAEHAWLEIRIDDQWELFDATTNTWISRSGFEMLDQAVREYRYFYTPLLDVNRPDARLHLAEGYDMQWFRRRLPLMGLSYFPPNEPYVQFDSTNWRELFPDL